MTQLTSPLQPKLAQRAADRQRAARLYGAGFGLLISQAARQHQGLILVVTADQRTASRLEEELGFFIADEDGLRVLHFPDWETLPYDHFSPHQDIISDRLTTLYHLPRIQRGVLIVPVTTLMTRLPPRSYLEAHSLLLGVGDRLDLEGLRVRLEQAGYRCVSQVLEHGEFAVRGSLIDLYPMGSSLPYRIELFDDEVESLRTFDPENQRSLDQVESIDLLPAREFPLDEEGVKGFRLRYRARFEGDTAKSLIYREVSNASAPAGVEYYLPLFHAQVATLFDYLPEQTLLYTSEGLGEAVDGFWAECSARYENLRHNIERPLLAPQEVFLRIDELHAQLGHYPRTDLYHFEQPQAVGTTNYACDAPPPLQINARSEHPAAALRQFVQQFAGRILFAAESPGRRESLLNLLRDSDIHPTPLEDWQGFLSGDARLAITVAPLEKGLLISDPPLAVVSETQLYGDQVVMQRRRRRARGRDADAVISSLAELEVGAPVVHEDHGVGRYLGLQTLDIGGQTGEFLTLEYADENKLYVPVASLELISRYTGTSPDQAPLHRLGSGQWEKAKRKAREKIRDVAAELLAIYAEREARQGQIYPFDSVAYQAFAAGFPFEETPDQQSAIDAVLGDMARKRPMDRLVCGDVGFGKTEVAMRAAFVAAMAGKQVAILVPTTLLAQQHHQNFADRFADWPIRIESLSRFRQKKEMDKVIDGLADGTVDIVIGTHKLIQDGIKYQRLGMVIIDEEHRFGVRQKERFKALRAEVDVLTLTATPIPRTLNMAFSGMRDLSVIASPPARRIAVKTFVSQWDKGLITEACHRELKRGGQIYFLHNEVDTIEKMARELEEIIPEATIAIAHGQMPERELERVMADFYHQRFNLLLCTTIIETGIDIPTANTIIINRADRFGLAQLYQLRGRVGRSHHRSYAYLVVPPKPAMTPDAVKRLEAIASIEELGTGFTLATHDLEIRGAGELLGEDQSGQMQEIGFTLYTQMLEQAVESLKRGESIDLDRPLDHGTEISLGTPALIPEDYLPDVHSRLILYKRIAAAKGEEELDDLQVEMIDRFGLLPEQTKALFTIGALKQRCAGLGILKIEVGPLGGRILFSAQPNIEPMNIIQLIQQQPQVYRFDGGDKLRITRKMESLERRVAEVERLLAQFKRGI